MYVEDIWKMYNYLINFRDHEIWLSVMRKTFATFDSFDTFDFYVESYL